MADILVVAPHPDDETLGCGGSLLRHGGNGDSVHWLIATAMREDLGYTPERMAAREAEIEAVTRHYAFAGVHRLGFPTTGLDTLPLRELIAAVANVLDRVRPEILYLPFPDDAHSDHRIVFNACAACSKWFRSPFLREILSYETLSETNFGLDPQANFRPNLYVDIHDHLDGKIDAMRLYAGETADLPFPRSDAAIRALAQLRGSESGYRAAEAFMILKQLR